MCSQDINILKEWLLSMGATNESKNIFYKEVDTNSKLDRSIFAHEMTYEYCMKEGITSEEWIKIKNQFKSKKHFSVSISIKERCHNVS